MKEFKKITEEMFCEESWDLKESVVDKVYTKIHNNITSFENIVTESLVNCESPIEQLLAIEMAKMNLLGIGCYNPFIDVLAIETQYEIECCKQKYRIDFLITVNYKNQGIKFFAVECDGHEFHQKTKEQVERDNKRMRDLQKNGCEVIRFSGTEIYHKSWKCASEIKNIIMSKCEYIKDSEV